MLTNTSGDKQAGTHTVNGKQSSRDHESLEKVDLLSSALCQAEMGADEQDPLGRWTKKGLI